MRLRKGYGSQRFDAKECETRGFRNKVVIPFLGKTGNHELVAVAVEHEWVGKSSVGTWMSKRGSGSSADIPE